MFIAGGSPVEKLKCSWRKVAKHASKANLIYMALFENKVITSFKINNKGTKRIKQQQNLIKSLKHVKNRGQKLTNIRLTPQLTPKSVSCKKENSHALAKSLVHSNGALTRGL